LKKRSKKKLFIWLGSILGALVIIVGVGGYLAINYAADKVLDSMMEEALTPEDTVLSSVAPSDSISPSPSDNATPDSVSSPILPSSEGSSQQPNSVASSTPASSGGTGKKPEGMSSAKPSGKENGTAPSKSSSNSSSPSPTPSSTYQAEISVEKAENVKENISFAEKAKVMSVMLKRLSASDIKTLQQLASGGLSVEKKREAKEIILKKLTEEEYDELIAIAKKYGLSQGKSYEDSQKEDLGD
jgi:hypothetical protein